MFCGNANRGRKKTPLWGIVLILTGLVIVKIVPGVYPVYKKVRRWRKRREHGNAPAPTPRPPPGPPFDPSTPKRTRALTLPLYEEAYPDGVQRTYDQQQSPFFRKLPYEVRMMIYELVLAPSNRVLHITTSPKRLCSFRCYSKHPELPTQKHNCRSVRDRNCAGPDHFGRQIYLGLLSSCRYIYSESVNILYGKNTLDIRNRDTFLALPIVFLPQRMASIRKMNFDLRDFHNIRTTKYWDTLCQILYQMDTWGLQCLDIRLEIGAAGSEVLFSLLNPLMEVRVPNFNLVLDTGRWSREEILTLVGREPPFSLEVTEFPQYI